MVLSNRLGGVKEALLLIVNPMKPDGRRSPVGVSLLAIAVYQSRNWV
jgi:hypothetical protein